LLLFLFSLWSYTQVRLTAASASPDFIAAIFVWSILFLLLEVKKDNYNYSSYRLLLVSFLSLIAVTIKLSVTPLLLIPAFAFFYFFKERRMKLLITVTIITVIVFTPFLTRNIISSGYPLYPSTALNIVKVDWKYDKKLVHLQKEYIKAYARAGSGETAGEIERINTLKLSEWIPAWWRKQSLADKTIFVFLLVSFFISLLRLKIILLSDTSVKITLLTTLTGIVFWFINAPDPRFGFGFIIGFIIIIASKLLPDFQYRFSRSLLLTGLTISIVAVTAYSVYRFVNFYLPHQWVTPRGIEKTGYTSFDCNDMKINMPAVNSDFGNIPVPCTDKPCSYFIPRGTKITDGFRAKWRL
jgi:hypothetical protein